MHVRRAVPFHSSWRDAGRAGMNTCSSGWRGLSSEVGAAAAVRSSLGQCVRSGPVALQGVPIRSSVRRGIGGMRTNETVVILAAMQSRRHGIDVSRSPRVVVSHGLRKDRDAADRMRRRLGNIVTKREACRSGSTGARRRTGTRCWVRASAGELSSRILVPRKAVGVVRPMGVAEGAGCASRDASAGTWTDDRVVRRAGLPMNSQVSSGPHSLSGLAGGGTNRWGFGWASMGPRACP